MSTSFRCLAAMAAFGATVSLAFTLPQLRFQGDSPINFIPTIENAPTTGFAVKQDPKFPGHALRVREPKNICDPSVHQKSGYLDVGKDKHFFFHFFESRSKPKSDPFILWLNGGPGCSSMTGLYMELGPCRVNMDGNGTTINEYSWNNNANIIFLDQPLGAGFSYGSDGAATTDAAAIDIHAFFQVFFRNYPEYSNAAFHIWGESYAGHYIPAAAQYINKQNKIAESEGFLKINLKSVGIGNGLTDSMVQSNYYEPMACGHGGVKSVLPEEECKKMRESVPTCRALADFCHAKPHSKLACIPAQLYCDAKLLAPYAKTGRNVYDIREMGDYKILEGMKTYLEREDVKKELGVEGHSFGGCDMKVNLKFMFNGDSATPYIDAIPELLADDIDVLIYAGDQDFICNWLGNRALSQKIEWPGQIDFLVQKEKVWMVDGKEAGEVRSYKGLTFLRVYDAGHMVPYDQGKNSLDMVNRWNAGKSFA